MTCRAASIAFAMLAIAGAVPAWATTMYCCTDDNGHKTCGDTLPQICYGRTYREIVDGVAKEVAPSMTVEQKAKRDADRAALVEHRSNQALLDSYTSVQDIDYMRDRSLATIARELKQGQEQFNDLQKTKQELAKKALPYKTTPMPSDLSEQIRVNNEELVDQQKVLDTKQQEMDDIRAKFEAEKELYLELTKKPLRERAAGSAAGDKAR